MIKYKNPLKISSGASGITTDLEWPRAYEYPSFFAWNRQSRGALYRNLIALHLREHGIPVADIASFLGISDSRVRIIVKKTALTLFGANWVHLPQVFAHARRRPSPLNERMMTFYQGHLQSRIDAILYGLHMVSYGSDEDTKLLARAGILIAQHKRVSSVQVA